MEKTYGKQAFLLVLLILTSFFRSEELEAKPVGLQRARSIALEFYRLQSGENGAKSIGDFILVYPDLDQRSKEKQATGCYIFNVGNEEGFVVVSAEDELRQVLAYSLQGSFEAEGMPENIAAWISGYEAQVLEYQENAGKGLAGQRNPSGPPAVKSVAIVDPLLENHPDGSILYDQRAPYNDSCPNPENRDSPAVSGCVATAMAMLARYHEWPVRSTGMVDYVNPMSGEWIQYPLGQEDYDWDNMLTTYNDSIGYTEEEARAVATLVRDMGGAVRMMYGYDLSAAYTPDVATALVSNMGYSQRIQVYPRDIYDDAGWTALVQTELEAGRPIYYSGSGMGGGHAFVCDGYDDQGYFHFNWGWSGRGNGWYTLDNLAPTDLGTGAGYGEYNNNQMVVVRIMPPAEDDRMEPLLMLDTRGWSAEEGVFDADRAAVCRVSGIWGYSFDTMDLVLGFTFWQDSLFSAVHVLDSVLLPPYYGWTDIVDEVNPAALLPEGEYQMSVGFKLREEPFWRKVSGNSYADNLYHVVVGQDVYWIGKTGKPENLPPRNLQVETKGLDAYATWSDPGLMMPDSYRVYLEGDLLEEIRDTSYVLEGLERGFYSFAVEAVYADGAVSEQIKRRFQIRPSGNADQETFVCRLFPNPAESSCHIVVPSACRMEVRTVDGRVLETKDFSAEGTYEVGLDGLAAGLYFVALYGKDGAESWLKLVVR